MKINLIFPALLFLASCGNQTENKDTRSDTTVSTTPVKPTDDKPGNNSALLSGCYMEVLKRDTFVASLQQNGNIITGRLSFDNYEKDGSTGTVSGKIDGNLLKLLYSFASEGMNSVMEVYFKEENGSLLRGTGDMNTRGDTVYFVNPGSLSYNGSGLKKMDCEKVPGKYK